MDTYKDYTTTLENAKQHIAEKGVAVIPNVLTSEEIQLYRGNMWNMLSQLTENELNNLKLLTFSGNSVTQYRYR